MAVQIADLLVQVSMGYLLLVKGALAFSQGILQLALKTSDISLHLLPCLGSAGLQILQLLLEPRRFCLHDMEHA